MIIYQTKQNKQIKPQRWIKSLQEADGNMHGFLYLEEGCLIQTGAGEFLGTVFWGDVISELSISMEYGFLSDWTL